MTKEQELEIILENLWQGEIDISKAYQQILDLFNIVKQNEKCNGCSESTGETKLWCCNHCGKRIEDF